MSYTRKNLVEDHNLFAGNDTSSVQSACLQDIARSMRAVAQNHQALIEELDRYKRWYKEEQEMRKRRDRQISDLRGVITKLKAVRP